MCFIIGTKKQIEVTHPIQLCPFRPPKQSLNAKILRGKMSCGSMANIAGPSEHMKGENRKMEGNEKGEVKKNKKRKRKKKKKQERKISGKWTSEFLQRGESVI